MRGRVPPVTLVLRYAARSDRGLVRANNEDSVYAGARLLALADGMGEMEQEIATLAKVSNATVETRQFKGNYPLPGVGAFLDSKVVQLPGCEDLESTYPHVMARPSASGWRTTVFIF